MAYYYGDLNIAMLKSCKREPLDLPLEVIILHILYYKLNVKDLYNLKILKFYYNLVATDYHNILMCIII